MTLTLFNKLYGHYKNTFSLEIRLKNANMTYDDLANKIQQDETWF